MAAPNRCTKIADMGAFVRSPAAMTTHQHPTIGSPQPDFPFQRYKLSLIFTLTWAPMVNYSLHPTPDTSSVLPYPEKPPNKVTSSLECSDTTRYDLFITPYSRATLYFALCLSFETWVPTLSLMKKTPFLSLNLGPYLTSFLQRSEKAAQGLEGNNT